MVRFIRPSILFGILKRRKFRDLVVIMGKLPWSRLVGVALVLLLALGITCGADAAKRKSAKPAASPSTADQFFKLKPMTVVIVQGAWDSCQPNCPRWIAADGDIADSSPAQFRKVLKQAGKLKLPVLINSPGGSVNAALEIGRMIRKAGLTVAVAETSYVGCAPGDKSCQLPKERKGVYAGRAASWVGYCASACPLILAGGVARYAESGTHVGVHQFHNWHPRERIRYLETYRMENGRKHVISRKVVSRKRIDTESYGIGKDMHAKLERYFAGMGVSPDLVAEMEKAPFSSLNLLTSDRLVALRLVSVNHGLDDLVGTRACSAVPLAPNCVANSVPPPPDGAIRLVRSGGNCGMQCPQWIAIDGRITAGSPDAFRAALAAAGNRKPPVVLNSRGGNFDAALEIGGMIRAAGLTTAVAVTRLLDCERAGTTCDPKASLRQPDRGIMEGVGLCDHECLYVLAGGVKRYHTLMSQAEFVTPGEKEGRAYETARRYLAGMGVEPELMADAATATAEHPLRMLRNKVFAYGIGNQSVAPNFLADRGSCDGVAAMPNCVRLGAPLAPAASVMETVNDDMIVVRMRAHGRCAAVCPEWIVADGVITPEAAQRFAAVLDGLGDARLPVFLNASHGDFAAAVKIGRLIREKHLFTAVAAFSFSGCNIRDASCSKDRPGAEPYEGAILSSGQCGNECLLALAGGVERYAANAAGTVFAPSGLGQSGGAARLVELTAYLREMSVSPDLVQIARNSGDPRPLSDADLRALRLGTKRATPEYMTDPVLCQGASPAPNCVERARPPALQ
jgi:hypothetical protein